VAPATSFQPEPILTEASDIVLLETVSLYLHIPFCHAKCHYCDFNSYAGMLGLRERYVSALQSEIRLAGERVKLADGRRRRCRTIFFGGGTPSLLTAAQVESLIEEAQRAFSLDADAEITLEANPGTLEHGHLDELRATGVNRLSMGAQTFDAALLRWMGRIHTPDDIETAFRAARAAGFESVNFDLIYALPGQSLTTWATTLERALALGPAHLSLYSLIVEEGTPLHRWVAQGRVRPADEDLAADMYELARSLLASAGYHHYEVSNWALPGHECRHNLTYWHNLPYIGLGAGAHGWYAGHRHADVRPIREYIARVEAAAASSSTESLPASAVVEDEEIPLPLQMAETAMLGMRLVDGLEMDVFAARFGREFEDVFGARLERVRTYGLLEVQGSRIRLSARGLLLGNEVFESLLPSTEA
jgi:oxygen-independent coproporphyrinogen-3 oxidase